MTTGFTEDENGPWIEKAPAAVLDYTIDWAEWLPADDSLSGTPTWTVPTGITKASQTNDTTTTTIWLSGGTVGTTYEISCTVPTAQGRTETRSFRVKVVPR